MYHFTTLKDLIIEDRADTIELDRNGDLVWSAESRDGRCTMFGLDGNWPTLEDIRAHLTDAGYRMAYEKTVDGETTEVWEYVGTSSEVSSDGHASQDKQ